MDAASRSRRFLLYPEAERGPDVPTPPEKPPNPNLYGRMLVVAAFVIEWVGFIRRAIWKNAGFGSLRDIHRHLGSVEARYDPAVFPIQDPSELAEGDSTLDAPAKEPNDTSPNAVAHYRRLYLSGELTPLDVAKALLPLIRRDTSPPGEHSVAWLEVHADEVLAAAEASTLRYKEGKSLGPLDGIFTAVKDEYEMEGHKLSLGSCHDWAGRREGADKKNSWCVTLMREAGAIVLGKLSLHEFGLDTSGYNRSHGTPLNPYNRSYYPGGSSSGAAYAIATGLCPVTMGSDGGGSIRIPSSFCSAFGLKPTHNRLSVYPCQNMSNTTTVNGPLAADMRSLISIYNAVNKPHASSPFPLVNPVSLVADDVNSTRTKVLGIPEAWIERADPVVKKICRAFIDRLVKVKGYTTVPVDIPLLQYGQTAHSLTLLADAGALLSKDTTGLAPANRVLLAVGRTTTAVDYQLAQKLRHVLMKHMAWLWKEHPGMILVTPTTGSAGWPIRNEAELNYGISDGDQTMKTMTYVWLSNFCGTPSLTVPAGFAKPEGQPEADEPADMDTAGKVPVGLMGMGEWCSEEALLKFGLDAEEVGMDLRSKAPTWVDLPSLATSGRRAKSVDSDETQT